MTTQGIMTAGTKGLFTVVGFSDQGGKTGAGAENFGALMKQNSVDEVKAASAAPQRNTVKEKGAVFQPKGEVNSRINGYEAGTQNTSKEETVDGQTKLFEQVSELLSQVKKAILDTLEISEDEFNKLLETLGLSVFDLFEPEVLQQLVLTQAGADNDVMQLLTNENMAGTLKELMNQINQMLEQSGISKEELEHIVTSEDFAKFLEMKEAPEESESFFAAGAVNDTANLSDALLEDVSLTNGREQPAEKNSDETKILEEGNQIKGAADKGEISFSAQRFNADGDAEQAGGKEEKESLKEGTMTQGELFVENLANSAGTKETDFTARLTQVEQMREIANQIIEQIKVVIRPMQTSLELQLNPEHLGRVNLNIVSKEGVMTAQFTAQNQIAKEAIESQIHMLKESLENQGIKVATIEVSVSEFDFSQQNPMEGGKGESQKEASKKRNFIFEDEAEFMDTAEEMMISQGFMGNSSINYTA